MELGHFHRKNTGGGDPAFQRQPNSQFAYISPLYKFVGLFTAICLGYILWSPICLLHFACVEMDDLLLIATLLTFLVGQC